MNKKSVQNYTEASIFPILTANQLVPAADQRSYLTKLNERLRLPKEHFDALYAELLTSFIQYVQVLPSRYGGRLGSMIYEGMHRAHLAIQLLFDTSEKPPEPLPPQPSEDTLKLRCPACQNIITINKNQDLTKIICPVCGKTGSVKH